MRSLNSLPIDWNDELSLLLDNNESTLAYLKVDLNTQLQFADGIIVMTSRRLIAKMRGEGAWQEWFFREDLKLIQRDHAGIGFLELQDSHKRLAYWRYRLSDHSVINDFIESFNYQRDNFTRNGTDFSSPFIVPEEKSNESAQSLLETFSSDESAEETPSTWTLLRLWRFAKPYKGRLLLGFLLTLCSTAATLVPPYLTMPLMDNVLIPYQNGEPINAELATFYLSGLLVAAIVAWILGWTRTYMLARVSERIGADLRTTTYEHLMSLSQDYFGGKRTGDLMARIGTETDRINLFLSLHLLDFATDVIMIAMTAVILVSINPWLALVTLVPLPIIAWLIHLVRDRLRIGFEKVDRIWAEVNNVLADTIPGIRVVKAFAQEKRESERFREANQRNLQTNDRVNKIWSLFTPTVTLLTEIGLLIVWVFGIWQISQDEITVGVLTAFLAYISRFYLRLDSMSRIVSITQKAAAGTKRIFDILDHQSNVPEPKNPVHLPSIQGQIKLENVSFRYGTRSITKNVSLTIQPGEMVGLVGHSGSGKSTLVNLICRFYDVAEGAILIDGHDVRSVPIADYRKHIGLVLQEPFLFFGTIASNIAYGKPTATHSEIVAAARAAHAHEFILRLPHGYDSIVGERGQALSGGERQRISIARALLIDPRILILDEATSSVDTTTEKEIQQALENLVRGRTTIAIAHRLSTLRKADRLIVLDRGKIVEIGNHDDLMAREGFYYRLYQAQARNIDTENKSPVAAEFNAISSEEKSDSYA